MKDNMVIYRIDIKNKKVSKEEVKSTYHFLGGRSLTSRILLDEVDPNCEPLGQKNKLIIAPGLLGGLTLPVLEDYLLAGRVP